MIRKWLKFNTNFVELLKNSPSPRVIDQKWSPENLTRFRQGTFLLDKSLATSTGSVTRSVRRFCGLPEEDSSDSDDSDTAIDEPPVKTELFEIRGPDQSGFLIEVREEDLQEVRRELCKLKGDNFHFDKSVISWFNIKCMLTAEASPNYPREQHRLARVHAIASGSEEVHKIDNSNFLFVNSVDKLFRAKRILENLGYNISGILYRFQPKQRINLDDAALEICHEFVRAVESLPKVISITHNLQPK